MTSKLAALQTRIAAAGGFDIGTLFPKSIVTRERGLCHTGKFEVVSATRTEFTGMIAGFSHPAKISRLCCVTEFIHN